MDTLRPLLQPLTHNLPTPIRDLGLSLLGPSCYRTLILDIDPASSPLCLKLALSKGLGIGIILASSIVKVPQILKLLSSRSASGLSFLAYLLETTAYLVGLAYNVRSGFPFSTFGETALILVQNVVIAVLVLRYSGKAAAAAVFVAGLAVVGTALFSENAVDMKTLGYLQAGAGALGVASKLPQIAAVWQAGSTGQLSAFTVRPHFPLSLQTSSSSSASTAVLTPNAGLQLPRRFTLAHLHHPAGGRRQADPVWLRGGVCAQCRPGRADGVLLERGAGATEAGAEAEGCAGCGDAGQGCTSEDVAEGEEQEPDDETACVDGADGKGWFYIVI